MYLITVLTKTTNCTIARFAVDNLYQKYRVMEILNEMYIDKQKIIKIICEEIIKIEDADKFFQSNKHE